MQYTKGLWDDLDLTAVLLICHRDDRPTHRVPRPAQYQRQPDGGALVAGHPEQDHDLCSMMLDDQGGRGRLSLTQAVNRYAWTRLPWAASMATFSRRGSNEIMPQPFAYTSGTESADPAAFLTR